jgi:hypothetical protein
VPTPTPLRCSQTRCWSPQWTAPLCGAMIRKVLHAGIAQCAATHRTYITCDAAQAVHRTDLQLTARRSTARTCGAGQHGAADRYQMQYVAPSRDAVGSDAVTSAAQRSAAMHPIAGVCSKKKCDTPQYVALNRSAVPNYDLLRNDSDALHRMYSNASTESGARTESRGSGRSAALAAIPGSGGSTATTARTSSGGSTATATRHGS